MADENLRTQCFRSRKGREEKIVHGQHCLDRHPKRVDSRERPRILSSGEARDARLHGRLVDDEDVAQELNPREARDNGLSELLRLELHERELPVADDRDAQDRKSERLVVRREVFAARGEQVLENLRRHLDGRREARNVYLAACLLLQEGSVCQSSFRSHLSTKGSALTLESVI